MCLLVALFIVYSVVYVCAWFAYFVVCLLFVLLGSALLLVRFVLDCLSLRFGVVCVWLCIWFYRLFDSVVLNYTNLV